MTQCQIDGDCPTILALRSGDVIAAEGVFEFYQVGGPMNPDGSFPEAKYDRHGRLVCPTCGTLFPVPDDYWLGRGLATCPNIQWKAGKHQYLITDDIAYAVNDIRSKSDPSGENKRILKTFEETPDFMKPKKDGDSLFIP